MRASFLVALIVLAFGCDQNGHEGDVTGLHSDGGGSEAGGCAVIPGGCIGSRTDAGIDGSIDAALDDGAVPDASVDAGPQPMCQAPTAGNHFTVRSSDGMTPPFTVQHVWATWNTDCSSPYLVLALTDADSCIDGAGQQFDIGFFTTGPMAPMTMAYMFGTFASAIALDYLPPMVGTTPPTDFACVMAGGTITFDSLSWPPLAGSNHVSGSLSVTLYPCGSTTMSPTWNVDGSFDVPIDTPQPVCP